MKEEWVLDYTGRVQPTPEDMKKGHLPYIADPDLVEAVRLALHLKRPLLLKGEPGCGKTQLAYHIAYEFSRNYAEGKGWPLFFWSVKSTSVARDGLYTYDAIGRLRDAQLASSKASKMTLKEIDEYVKMGQLGKAFEANRPAIVLIDEIDKADIDFPNDLLAELERNDFFVPELNKPIKANHKPLVIITSNDEKDLPDAFLRRCVFYFIRFPNPEILEKIIQLRFGGEVSTDLSKKAVDRFIELRNELKREKGEGSKLVSTSELLDWVDVLQYFAEDEQIKQLNGQLPYLSVLLKRWEDHQAYLILRAREREAAKKEAQSA